MNPRQRRGALLVTLAACGAVAVFIAVAGYVADVRAQVGPMTTVLRLRGDVAAFRPITTAMLEEAQLPERWAPATATRSPEEVVGLVAATALPKGSIVQQGMLVPASGLLAGQREIAILVDAETGVAGKVAPGSMVDIYATFEGDQQRGEGARSEIIVTRARIIEVGPPATATDGERGGTFAEGKVVPVTFALSIQESLVLMFAESFATKVRLALIDTADPGAPTSDERTFTLADRLPPPAPPPPAPPTPPGPAAVGAVPAPPPA